MEYKVPVLPPSWTALLGRVRSAIYQTVRPLSIQAWVTPEPMTFADREKGNPRILALGDSWSTTLFDCAWFRFECEALPTPPSPLFARIDVNGELCIVDDHGTPLRGLTCVRSLFEPAFGAPGKTVFEIPTEFLDGGKLVLWADGGMNDLLGTVPGGGKIELAELCVRREHTRDFYYDLEVATDFFLLKPENDPMRRPFDQAVQELSSISDWSLRDDCLHARALIKALTSAFQPERTLNISAIGHAHLDLAWLWPVRETIRKGARTLASALYNIDRYDDYRFGCSQPQLLSWIKEYHPALFERTKLAVADGKVEPLGTFWVEPDCNIPNGESLVRQILHGRRFFQEEFGHVPNFCWQPDVFGYNGQLPQILKKSGHDYFMTQKLSWNVVNRFPHHSFHWKGIDDTSILVHMLPEETYNGPALPRSVAKIQADYAEAHCSHHAMMVFGIGDGGGGPDAEHLERLRRLNDLNLNALTINESAAEFFEKWSAESGTFPVHQGELYLERHQGTFTTQADLKSYNRQCEILLRDVEWAAIMAGEVTGTEYPSQIIDQLWKDVLLFQFHDILPGSSIRRVHEETAARYREIVDTLTFLRVELYTTIANKARSALLFNSLSWTRSEWVLFRDQWHLVTLPPMGWTAIEPMQSLLPAVIARHDFLENEHLRAEFSSTGSLVSLFHKRTDSYLIRGAEANVFVAFLDEGDAWDFPIDYSQKDVLIYLRQTPATAALIESSVVSLGVVGTIRQTYRLLNSTIDLEITLKAHSPILEFQAAIDWRDKAYTLRAQFPTTIVTSHARYEIPFGSILRPTDEESSQAKAQFECPAQQWVDLSEAKSGLALINDCKYGFRVKGSTIDMAVLRCVPYPGLAQLGADGNASVGKSSDFSGLGEHEFRYALYPHTSSASLGEITKAARCFNNPPIFIEHEHGTAVPATSFISIDSDSIEVVALKPTELGEGYTLRLSNVENAPVSCAVRFSIPFRSISEANLVETNVTPVAQSECRGLDLEFSAFEVRTFLLMTCSGKTEHGRPRP